MHEYNKLSGTELDRTIVYHLLSQKSKIKKFKITKIFTLLTAKGIFSSVTAEISNDIYFTIYRLLHRVSSEVN